MSFNGSYGRSDSHPGSRHPSTSDFIDDRYSREYADEAELESHDEGIAEDLQLEMEPDVIYDNTVKSSKNPLSKVKSVFSTKKKKKYSPQEGETSGQNSSNKFTSLFKKKKKTDDDVETVALNMNVSQTPVDTMPKPRLEKKSTLREVKNFVLHPPPKKMEGWVQTGPEVAETRPIKDKHHVRSSTILWFLLISGFIAGFVMTCLHEQGEAEAVLGPTFMVLSLLAMVGKCFFALIWESEPFPRLTPYIEKFDEKFAHNKDKTPEKVLPWEAEMRTDTFNNRPSYGNEYGQDYYPPGIHPEDRVQDFR